MEHPGYRVCQMPIKYVVVGKLKNQRNN